MAVVRQADFGCLTKRDLHARVALVTGGAGGIGLGMARAFQDANVRVAIADIDYARLAGSFLGARANRATAWTVCIPSA